MFIPIGGVFVLGTGGTRHGAIRNLIIGLINLIPGVLFLVFGYVGAYYPFQMIFRVFGYIITAMALLMLIFSLIALIKLRKNKNIKKAPENDIA